MRFQSLMILCVSKGNLADNNKDLHSIASLKVENNSTLGSLSTSTFSKASPIGDFSKNPQKTSVACFAASNRWTRTNASAEDISTPPTAERSTTRKRMGLLNHDGSFTTVRIVSSTFVMVPKNKKPEMRCHDIAV